MRDVNVYCDSSCDLVHDNLPIMIHSFMEVAVGDIKKHKREIKSILKRHNYEGELKWKYVSNLSLPLYIDIVDFYKASGLKIQSIVVDKSKFDFKDEDFVYPKFFFDNYYHLFRNSFVPDSDSSYKMFFLMKDTRSANRLNQLRARLDSPNIESSQFITSGESVLLQVVDFVMGALNYKLRFSPSDSLPSKLDIVNRIFGDRDLQIDLNSTIYSYLSI